MSETEYRDPGEVPVLDWIDKTLIDIDTAYQRRLDEGRVERILTWFRWDTFGAIVVVPAPEGRFHCTDGQHRLEAAKRHPKVVMVPAIIIDVSGTAAEAENFIGLNRERKNISAIDRYWAELAAGDDDAKTIDQVVARAGVTIARYPSAEYQPGQTIAISALRALVDRHGALVARQVLEILAGAKLAPIKGEHIRAAEILRTDDEFREEVEPMALAEALELNGEAIADEAKVFAKTHRLMSARALASVWFRRTRKKRKAA